LSASPPPKKPAYTARKRANLAYKIQYAIQHPEKVRPYLTRLSRDTKLRFTTKNHVDYYRGVMAADVATRGAAAAVGSGSQESWLRIGKMQFEFLRAHGLRKTDTFLEIGCGNLRAGWRIIDFLEPGNYYGIDISPDILLAAGETLTERGLQAKLPHMSLVKDLKFATLPDAHFDVAHAHSVFSHTPIEILDECLGHIGRILKPTGFFDFTFDRTEEAEHQVLREDFYFQTQTLIDLAARHGLRAEFSEDWEKLRHKQSKIRVTHS